MPAVAALGPASELRPAACDPGARVRLVARRARRPVAGCRCLRRPDRESAQSLPSLFRAALHHDAGRCASRACVSDRGNGAVRIHALVYLFAKTVRYNLAPVSRSVNAGADAGVTARLGAFVTERFPFALDLVLGALDTAGTDASRFRAELMRRFAAAPPVPIEETTPGVSGDHRRIQAVEELADACEGFLRREAIKAALTPDERRELLRGMLLTRATDNRLKVFFGSGEVRYGAAAFQGKGFRSLGQEAIYAAGLRLRRGEAFRGANGWQGDVVGPLIRDLGVALAMRPTADTVRMVLSAQMAKAGPPMEGRDLHIGDLDSGILPAAAPLAISTLTIAGMA